MQETTINIYTENGNLMHQVIPKSYDAITAVDVRRVINKTPLKGARLKFFSIAEPKKK